MFSHRPHAITTFLASLVGLSATLSAQAQRPPSPLNAMEHGPFVSSTIATDPLSTRSIFVYKGVAVKVGKNKDAVFVFDTDLLRPARAWTGGFLKWYPARDGLQEWPSPDGYTHFSTGERPGWSTDGKFGDPRPWRYGPVPKSLGSYKGLYLNEDRVVFSYQVGGSGILESPSFEPSQGKPVFTRSFELEPTGQTLSLHICEIPDGSATRLSTVSLNPNSGYTEIKSGDHSRLIGFRGLPANSKWRLENRHLALDLPPSQSASRFQLSLGPVVAGSQPDYMVQHLEADSALPNLTEQAKPGPAQWETIETKIKRGNNDGPFTTDELTLPSENPWNSYLRFSGVDFLSDGRAVISCLSGEVWIVDGLNEDSDTLKWTRYATGLNQPHGVKVVDDVIHVTARDQITRLHDRNGDGEADFYENFNNEVMAATNFHAFTMNLDTDSEGNFYFAKATPWPPSRYGVDAEITPHHGVLFRLPPDGSRLDIVASGLRNPNGLTIGPDDEIVYSDNEGNWVPTSKVHRIRLGSFHGFVPSAQFEPQPTNFEKPILWVPHFIDNSPSTPIFITSSTWPKELQGNLLVTSYGRGTLSLILNEKVDDQWQGAHLTLPLNFQSGTIHGRFHPKDGHLYIAGLTSWQSVGHGGDWGSFHRVRYTGKPLNIPVAVNTKKGGLELRFTEPLDTEIARETSNYRIRLWTYPWTSQYGTRGKIYSAFNPGETTADIVTINSVQISNDRKTLTLEIPKLRQDLAKTSLGQLPGLPDMVDTPMGLIMAIDYQLRFQDGTEASQQIHKTIHRVAGDEATHSIHEKMDHSASATVSNQSTSISDSQKEAAVPKVNIPDGARVVDMKSTGIALSYDVTDIRMKAGETLFIRYRNASEMNHNIVIVKSEEDIYPVGIAALSAQTDDFVPQNLNPTAYRSQEQDRILAASELAYPGDTVILEFTPPRSGTYPYICTFTGHFTMMQGRIHVEP